MSGSNKLFILFLLGTIFLNSVDSARSPRQRDVVEESCEEEDDADNYDENGKPKRVGATNTRKGLQPQSDSPVRNRADDDWDGVEDPTDDDYLRYENTNQEGICLLERGKCPSGDWKMFKRATETVCLKIVGSQLKIGGHTAGEMCRENANARLMTVDSHEERKWIFSTALGGNHTYPMLLIAGYRNRECRMKPLTCTDHQTAFVKADGTSDHKYIYSHWRPAPHNRYAYGYLDDCLNYLTSILVDDPMHIEDFTCNTGWFNTVLCGVTVM